MTETPPSDPIAAGLAAVRAVIARAAAARPGGGPVRLIAVSKTQPVDRLHTALAAGQRAFGENRVQEARAKWSGLRDQVPDLDLHLIGPLQTNKVREAVALFDVIHTLDRPRLALALAAEMARTGRRPGLFIEVNTGAEPQKAGIAPEAVPDFLALCRDSHGLPILGLMAIPPVAEDPAFHFALLADLARRLGLSRLSMGMSADYDLAIRFGATDVRVGTAIFGARPAAVSPPESDITAT